MFYQLLSYARDTISKPYRVLTRGIVQFRRYIVTPCAPARYNGILLIIVTCKCFRGDKNDTMRQRS